MGIVCFTLNLDAEKYVCKVKFWWPLQPWEYKWAEGRRGKENLTVGWFRRPPPPPRQSGYWTLWLPSQPASRHTVSESASQSRLISSLGTWCVRDFVDWRDVMWGFDAATGELNLCLLGACSPHLRHLLHPPGCSYPSALAASPDTLVVVSCHWNDVTRLSDSRGLLLKVIVPAKEKPSPRINGHWTACEQRDKNGREKIN